VEYLACARYFLINDRDLKTEIKPTLRLRAHHLRGPTQLPSIKSSANGHGSDAAHDDETHHDRSPYPTFPRKREKGQTIKAIFTSTALPTPTVFDAASHASSPKNT